MKQSNIRNFAVVAHIDHGKSTLADRFLELTGAVNAREMKSQYLDQMDLEREKGITIKLQPVRMFYRPKTLSTNLEILNKSKIPNSKLSNQNLEIRNSNLDIAGSEYILNLIDTPGHVDFSYEVSRSLAAVEGVILLVDATQGVQAQTLTNLHLAQKQGLVIIPVINKIDQKSADIDAVKKEIISLLGVGEDEILLTSAKTGEGVKEILDQVVEKIPAPIGSSNQPLQALIFDSAFNPYKGVIAYIRINNGALNQGDTIKLMARKLQSEAVEIGYFSPKLVQKAELSAGEIGYIATGLKEVSEARVGDTITILGSEATVPLPGYMEPKPFIFASIFSSSGDPKGLRESLSKLKLNDAALVFEPEHSPIFGQGFRCGFLGLLHLEITKERLEREYELDLLITTPSVPYKILIKNTREEITINNPTDLPDLSHVEKISEPYISLEVITPEKYLGAVMELTQGKRGVFKEMNYLISGDENKTVILNYEIPLAEVIIDFYDQLKSVSSGYASLNYDFLDFRPSDLEKLDILVAGEKVDALSSIVPKESTYRIGRHMVGKLKELIPKQMFAVTLQAAIGGKILAREDIPAMRKDVTGHLYGGDVTRKRKLLEKQKKGKKRMKRFGKIDIPTDVFIKVVQK